MLLGGLTVACCNTATVNTEHDDGCGRKKNQAIILICHSFWGFETLSAECVEVSVI